MIFNYKGWRNSFLFCLGLFLGTAFCMKWLETRFYYQGELFTIIGLEITYGADRLKELLQHTAPAMQTLLRGHFYFDFVFMAGAYGGIASLLMMARYRVKGKRLRTLLWVLATAQLLAWVCDIRENVYLLQWMAPEQDIGKAFFMFHVVVMIKWLIAISGLLVSVPVLLWKRKG